MATASVHLMLVNLHLQDSPVGYRPPVGPAVEFEVCYNHRDAFQPGNFTYSNFGSKWTCDWISYITDNPQSPSADVNYYLSGGGASTFTGFDPATQTFAFEQYYQTRLTRTGAASYEMLWPDGSKLVFSQSDGSVGTSRKVFLTQMQDPFGNAVTLTYDSNLRLTAITDAIGQVTALTYGLTNDLYKITKVTDPFGRFALFDYDATNRLSKITDVIGITSQFNYEGSGDFINSLTTPYGTTSFTRGGTNTTRWLETLLPDGSRERVEFNQTITSTPMNDPAATVPTGMVTTDDYLQYRNTYYWSRTACATGYGDYTKARIYHWLHTADFASASGILESFKEPLENRVWYNYAGQHGTFSAPASVVVGSNNLPSVVGRVLDDGTTQLRTYAYDGFGHVTNSVDPVGRTFSYIYSTNGIDLLEVRMTRAGKNELLSNAAYNDRHLPLTRTDAAGQTTTYTYNARGQILTETNPRNEITTSTYDANGYLLSVDGPLSGTNDVTSFTYDSFGRVRTKTDVSGYTLTFEFDALDHLVRITHPDSTYEQVTYDRLDPVVVRDRAGRQTLLEYNSIRQLVKRTDPLGRVTLFQWCTCGDLSSLTDPMGRTTFWNKDVQGRLTSKQYGDGSRINYVYENTTSRLRQVIDEKQQIRQFAYNPEDTLKLATFANALVPTPSVTYSYDPDYERITSITDGTGTTLYSYNPVAVSPNLGAGQLASVDGPLPNDTITYEYDELGRRVSTAIDGVATRRTFDAADRVISETNALGLFAYTYDGASRRVLSETAPNGQTSAFSYEDNLHDHMLQRITWRVGPTPVSEFIFGRDIAAGRITTWSQQTGTDTPSLHTFGYDAVNQLVSDTVTGGAAQAAFAYSYDPAGNRLREQLNAITNTATYNALNQISTTTASGTGGTNEWDGANRLVIQTSGNQRTEFAYDERQRLSSIREFVNGSEVSSRRLLWDNDTLCEERDDAGTVTKRFFPQGVRLETGPNAGRYYYTRDHLRSVRELTDFSGSVRARYAYDPFGRRSKISGDLDADFGFTGLFWSSEASLFFARFRAYDPQLARWLSRDPLPKAEETQGPNLYTYVGSNPVNHRDPLGLCCEAQLDAVLHKGWECGDAERRVSAWCDGRPDEGECWRRQLKPCYDGTLTELQNAFKACLAKPCEPPPCASPGAPPGRRGSAPPTGGLLGSGIRGEALDNGPRW
jgi:RHS repeat-associated protein